MKDASRLKLSNEKAALHLWTDSGGRAIHYGRPDGANQLGYLAPEEAPEPFQALAEDEVPPHQDYRGHEVWLAPQSAWWQHQAVTDLHHGNWPPDPWLCLAPFEVLAQDEASVSLQSPPSPVSGVTLRKDYRLEADGSLDFTVSLTNIREEPVSWGLWTNTRAPVGAILYMPVRPDHHLRIETRLLQDQQGIDWAIEDGLFRIDTGKPFCGSATSGCSKFFLDGPEHRTLASLYAGELFIKERLEPSVPQVHGEQSPLEVFVGSNPGQELLIELEMHGDYVQLEAGASSVYRERWKLLPCENEAQARALLAEG